MPANKLKTVNPMQKTLIALLLAWAISPACSNFTNELDAILRISDRRAPVSEMQPYLQHPAPEVRRQAVIALGQMLDTTAVDLLLPLLDDPVPEIRCEAIFALGQLGNARVQAALLTHWPQEKNDSAKQDIVEALGKVGDARSSSILRAALADSAPGVQGRAALAIARLANRDIALLPLELTGDLAVLLRNADANLRWRAAYALMRLADSNSADLQTSALDDPNPRVRMFAARGLGQLHATFRIDTLGPLAHGDPDWRVRVNATRALGKLAPPGLLALLPVNNLNEHVRLAALEALETAAGTSLSRRDRDAMQHFLQSRLDDAGRDWRERAAAANALAVLLRRQAVPMLTPYLDFPQANFRARLASALGKTQSPDAFAHLQHLYDSGPLLVKVAVLDAIGNLEHPGCADLAATALREGDAVLTALAATWFARQPEANRGYGEAILQSFRALARPVDVEPAAMIFEALATLQVQAAVPVLQQQVQVPDRAYAKTAARALEKLTGKAPSTPLPENKPWTTFSYDEIMALRGKTAVIETRYGKIGIALLPEAAPLTVLNFVRLAQQGFFDGLTFHRVVPNFVIQGGDPRGDSWGSPGYSIRSEFNREHYETGTVGMASAGPDTEGCQFFITHSPQPHLDGRYTIFGKVIFGQEVVDQIQAGDAMVRVRVE